MTERRFADRTVLALAAAAYLPLVFLGFGADGDSYSVVDSARTLLATGHYSMSRVPGFPTHELATAALVGWGGSIATNLGSVALSLLGLWSLLRICVITQVPSRDLVVAIVACNPLYWINSASTIDYVWALGLALAGWHAWLSRRPVLSGVLFGLAIGARITTVVLPVAVAIAAAVDGDPATRTRPSDIVRMLSVAALISMALFLVPFAAEGYTFGFLRPEPGRRFSYDPPGWRVAGRVARFVYKNLYLLGPFATAWALVCAVASRVGRMGVPSSASRPVLVVATLSIVGVEAVFLAAPIETAYLIPVLPFMALALAVMLPSRRMLAGIIVLELVYACVNVRLLQPDVPGNATTARFAPRLEAGVLIGDVRDRLLQRTH